MAVKTIGLDIGGANIKASDGDGVSLSHSFALWRHSQQLGEALSSLVAGFTDIGRFSVTMTGELADCFRSKAEGVECILNAVEQVANGRPVYVWQTSGEFVPPTVAREHSILTAAANWHALATWVGRAAPEGPALLMDVGSTTTDIIPLDNGLPFPEGRTDVERLMSGELVYSGVVRTPLCAIAHSVPFRDGYGPLAAEHFASARDVYLWLGDLAEQPDVLDTADGRPATREAARDRLARMLCCDRTEFSADDADVLSRFLADVQRQRIAGCLDRVLNRMQTVCRLVAISGEGEFLARRILAANGRVRHCEVLSLAESVGPPHSQAACAFALAQLAAERLVAD